MFGDRTEAGTKLAEKLEDYRGQDVVVLALPRGGVPIGYEIAKFLDAPLDIVSVRKIGHPHSPEYALGSIHASGHMLLNSEEAKSVGEDTLKELAQKEQNEASRRQTEYRADREVPDIQGKTAILVDDGIATGMTMRLAVQVTHEQAPKEIIVAVPVTSQEAMDTLLDTHVKVTTLEPPEKFRGAVGAHYILFPQLKDEEVVELLNRAN